MHGSGARDGCHASRGVETLTGPSRPTPRTRTTASVVESPSVQARVVYAESDWTVITVLWDGQTSRTTAPAQRVPTGRSGAGGEGAHRHPPGRPEITLSPLMMSNCDVIPVLVCLTRPREEVELLTESMGASSPPPSATTIRGHCISMKLHAVFKRAVTIARMNVQREDRGCDEPDRERTMRAGTSASHDAYLRHTAVVS